MSCGMTQSISRRWPLLAALTFVGAGLLTAAGPRAGATDADAPVPELIGEGVISTPDDELGGSTSADGQTLYFEKSAPPHYLYVMLESHLVNGRWGQPEMLPFSGLHRDTDPVLTPDGRTLLFASDRPVNGVDKHHFYIWAATRTEKGWNEPRLLDGPVNSGFDQVFASMAANGNIYFTSSRKTGSYDIFRTRLENGQYQPEEELAELNGPGIASFEAFVSPDESYLLIGSFGREETVGSSDLYISYRQSGAWTKPKNLGPMINSPARDYSPRVSLDGKWMYFTSERLDHPLSFPLSVADFERFSHGLYNGLGNLYRVPLDYVLRTTRP